MSDNEEEKSQAGSEQPEPLAPAEPVKKEQLVKGLSRIQRTHGKWHTLVTKLQIANPLSFLLRRWHFIRFRRFDFGGH